MPGPQIAWRISPQLYAWSIRGAPPGPSGLPAALLQGIEDAALAAYDGVEFSLSWLQTPDRVPAVREHLRSRGMKLAALFATVNDRADATALAAVADVAKRAFATDCALLNLATVPLAPRQRTAGEHLDGELAPTIHVLETTGALLRDSGISLCWHPHDADFRNGGEGLQRVLAATDPAEVGICLDLGWIARVGEDSLALMRTCTGRLRMLHVRNVHHGYWSQSVDVGDLDLGAVGAYLQQSRYEGWLAVELWFERQTSITRSLDENALLSARALRACLTQQRACQ